MKRFFLTASLLAVAGCKVGPNYAVPDLPVPPRFVETTAAGATADPSHWWTQFHDPELDRLIMRAIAGNLDLQTAKTRITGARAQEREARSALLPSANASAGVNRIDFSKNAGLASLASAFGSGGGGGSTPGQGIALPGSGITTWSIGIDASWEVDLFGGVQRGIEGARARTAAAEWNVRDMQVSVVAEVASDYLMLRSLQSQIAIAKAELIRQQATLRLIDARQSAGLVSELPQRQQSLQLSNVAATLPQLEARARDQIHALGVLVGEGPGALTAELDPAALLPALPPAVPAGLPSDLLRRRPDVRAAERQLAAATADVGVATADLYPKFNLMGMAELISTSLATLVERNSIQTTGNAAFTLPIFDGGKRRGVIAEREASRAEALLTYKKTMLVAVQDVEDALADYNAELKRNAELRRGVAAAERATQLAQASFLTGLTDFQPVLDAQGSVLSNRNTLAQSDATLLTDLARLYKALGGGWEA
ncbi:efflux transporter outer membrane subunit [Polymorphobacter megasporae]|uniref:efflux transporter outer membrane subunit n=1 Tax=Glacieibacterium megasporae TaxID=2835787 RepID=UPI001C1E505F|nr:efflux transporter outer membrane subunit [Polymorphobacter megasporae]UAJ11134.1 efflux transporter outer membrane subunit [Polymorphobacter megasporae]